MVYKIRTIAKQLSGEEVKGVTIPNKVAMFFENTYFNIEKSGTAIILTSGTTQIITKQQVEEYTYEDFNTK